MAERDDGHVIVPQQVSTPNSSLGSIGENDEQDGRQEQLHNRHEPAQQEGFPLAAELVGLQVEMEVAANDDIYIWDSTHLKRDQCRPLIPKDKVPPPEHPEYSQYDERIETYAAFPCADTIQEGDENVAPRRRASPEALATAGFFYSGNAHIVLCYYCGGEMNAWFIQEEAIYQSHARTYLGCPNISLTKGAKFARDEFQAADDNTRDCARNLYMTRNSVNSQLVLLPELAKYIDDASFSYYREQQQVIDEDIKNRSSTLNISNPAGIDILNSPHLTHTA